MVIFKCYFSGELIALFVLFEVCGTVLVNSLLKEFAICVDVTEGLLLKEIV